MKKNKNIAGWKKKRLKEIAIVNAKSLPASTPSDFFMKYLEISNVNYNGIISHESIRDVCFADSPSRARRIVTDGDTLISSVRPNLQAVAYIEKAGNNLIASTGFNVVSPNICQIFPKYSYYLLISEDSKQYFEAVAKGVGYPAVDEKDFLALSVNLPPIGEQKRIIAFLDKICAKIDATIEIKSKQLKVLDELRKSIIHKAVTRGLDDSVELKDSGIVWMGKIPKSWKIEKLKHITELIIDGTHLTPTYIEAGIPFLRVTDIQSKEINLSAVKYIPEEEHNELIKRVKPKRDDVLLSKNGTIGLLKVVDWDWEFSIFVSLCLIRLQKKINPYYFTYYFESDIADQQLFESSKKTSVTNLHLVKIREMLMAVPPPSVQKELVDFLNYKTSQISLLKNNLNAQIKTLEQYRKSLIHECVTGKCRITEDDLKET